MNCWLRQEPNGEPVPITIERLFEDGNIWAPLIVQSENEFNYLQGMMLVTGKELFIYLDGRDKLDLDTPPTWISIPGAK